MKKNLIGDIGKRLQELRRILGLQQNELAQAVGLNPGYLSEIENGVKNNPGIATIFKITSHYNVSLDYLVHGIGGMFLPDEGSDEKRRQRILEGVESIEDVAWLMKNSRYVKNTILAYTVKIMIENESFIIAELRRASDKEGDSANGSNDNDKTRH
jgi:transcriptional regulator with XRE-family HTH domain